MVLFRKINNFYFFRKVLLLFLRVFCYKKVLIDCRISFIRHFIFHLLRSLLAILDILVTLHMNVSYFYNVKRRSFFLINRLFYYYNILLRKFELFVRYSNNIKNFFVNINYKKEVESFVCYYLTIPIICIFNYNLCEIGHRCFGISDSWFFYGEENDMHFFSVVHLTFKLQRVFVCDLISNHFYFDNHIINSNLASYAKYLSIIFAKKKFNYWRYLYYFVFILSQRFLEFDSVSNYSGSVVNSLYYNVVRFIYFFQRVNRSNYIFLFKLMLRLFLENDIFSNIYKVPVNGILLSLV